MLIFLSSITSGEEEVVEEEGEAVPGGYRDLYGYPHHPPPPACNLSTVSAPPSLRAAAPRRCISAAHAAPVLYCCYPETPLPLVAGTNRGTDPAGRRRAERRCPPLMGALLIDSDLRGGQIQSKT